MIDRASLGKDLYYLYVVNKLKIKKIRNTKCKTVFFFFMERRKGISEGRGGFRVKGNIFLLKLVTGTWVTISFLLCEFKLYVIKIHFYEYVSGAIWPRAGLMPTPVLCLLMWKHTHLAGGAALMYVSP